MGVAQAADIPFKGDLQGVVTRSGAPPIISVDIHAAGNATHLGNFAVSIPHQVTVATKTAIGAYLFVAANGTLFVCSQSYLWAVQKGAKPAPMPVTPGS